MPLKTHIIIISIIIALIFAGWQTMRHYRLKELAELEALRRNQLQQSVIQVVRANWGLNCNKAKIPQKSGRPSAAGRFEFEYGNEEPRIYENNVLDAIQRKCGHKPRCTIANNADSIGFDVAPLCADKQLVIEYRCYAFDRLWRITIPHRGSGSIDCSKVEPPK